MNSPSDPERRCAVLAELVRVRQAVLKFARAGFPRHSCLCVFLRRRLIGASRPFRMPPMKHNRCCRPGIRPAVLRALPRSKKRGSSRHNWQPLNQQPRQIDAIILLTFASSLSRTGLVPSSGPFIGWAVPDDESAVPEELVPGAVGLVPEAPPVTEPWWPPPPPRANAALMERLTHRAMQIAETRFMIKLPRTFDQHDSGSPAHMEFD